MGVVNVKKQNDGTDRAHYRRKVGRMGNSLGIGLPKRLAETLNVVQGDEIEFTENDRGEIVLRKVRQTKLPDNVRIEVLEAFYDVFEEDEGILNDLRDK